MTAKLIKLLPDDELKILDTYLYCKDCSSLENIFNDLGVPDEVYEVTRCEAAVAQILLHHIQDSLPSWGYTRDDGSIVLGRFAHQRHKDARLQFNPKHLMTVNWADSGPGISWPEKYLITYLPSFNKYVVTASRDGEDAFGCSDHAIGFADEKLNLLDAARQIIVANWHSQSNGWDQGRWAYVFDEGLVDKFIANKWADEVWPE